jgi:hypothetical protein
MAQVLSPLMAFAETQEVQALERLTIIRPALVEITQAQVVRTFQLTLHTVQPCLTLTENDYNRVIANYRLTFQKPTALILALALPTGISLKEDPYWHDCDICEDVEVHGMYRTRMNFL